MMTSAPDKTTRPIMGSRCLSCLLALLLCTALLCAAAVITIVATVLVARRTHALLRAPNAASGERR